MRLDKASFFKKPLVVFLIAMLCCALWGSAFPCVKLGMQMLGITSDRSADQIVFAGMRFTLAGILVIVFGSLIQRRPLIPRRSDMGMIAKLSFFQTIGQYFFYYIGLAHAKGVNATIASSTSRFFIILTACLVFRIDKLTGKKIVGCLMGFAGVLLITLTGGEISADITFIGEGLIIISAFSAAISSCLSKIYSRDVDPVLLCGCQFFLGGLVLFAGGLLFGGTIAPFDLKSSAMLLYLALISSVAYTLWTVLLKYNEVCKVTIYGFMNQVFGLVLSVLILKESNALSINHLYALIIISAAIILVNGEGKEKVPKKQASC